MKKYKKANLKRATYVLFSVDNVKIICNPGLLYSNFI